MDTTYLSFQLDAISTVDGRYRTQLEKKGVHKYASEASYIRKRADISLAWLEHVLKILHIEHDYNFSKIPPLTDEDVIEIKKIEYRNRHDVRAIIDYLRIYIVKYIPNFKHEEYIHFGLTSQDLNSMAFMINFVELHQIINNSLKTLLTEIRKMIDRCGMTLILTKTHGQPAPTSPLRKEIYIHFDAIYTEMIELEDLIKRRATAKFGGAIGNHNALYFAVPEEINWMKVSDTFVQNVSNGKLKRSKFTTQVDEYNNVCKILQSDILIASLIRRFAEYIWTLIRDRYFLQELASKDIVGSSTLMYKINPVSLENALGLHPMIIESLNGVIRVLLSLHDSRDISDSVACRNIPFYLSQLILMISNVADGIMTLRPHNELITQQLHEYPCTILEGIQTLLKRCEIKDAYEQLKALSQKPDYSTTMKEIHEFIDGFDLDVDIKEYLKSLTVETYIGVYDYLEFHGL